MSHFPLMKSNISRDDLDAVIEFLRQDDPILTHSSNVREFEAEWSNWLGVNHSVFVNSGSSANLLSMAVIRDRYPSGGEVLVPALTWSSDIASVLHTGFTPVFVDISPSTLAMDPRCVLSALTDNTVAVFLTHAQGFNGLTDHLLEELDQRNIVLIEDVCESHGAMHRGMKLGTFGQISNFSFYYAHHMSTIEGGMVCTDDKAIYDLLRMLRSHGMVRELVDEDVRKVYESRHSDLNPEFIFAACGYNFRNNEIGALIGINQLKRLDSNISKRNRNHELFLSELDQKRFRTDFFIEGSSNYAFNLILNEPDVALFSRVCRDLEKNGIEYRRGSAGGGNQLRQPYVMERGFEFIPSEFPVVEHVHFFGMYIGNYPDLGEVDIRYICSVLNSA